MWSKCSRCSKRTISRNAVQYSHSPSAWGRDYGCFTFYSSVHCPAGRPDRYSASTSFLLFWTEEALESAVTALFAFVGCGAAASSPLPIHRGLLPPDNVPYSAGWPYVFVAYPFLRANSSSTCAFCCSSASASSTDCLLSITDCNASFTSEEYA